MFGLYVIGCFVNLYNDVFFGLKEEWDTMSDVSLGISGVLSVIIICMGFAAQKSLPSFSQLFEREVNVSRNVWTPFIKSLRTPEPIVPLPSRGDLKEIQNIGREYWQKLTASSCKTLGILNLMILVMIIITKNVKLESAIEDDKSSSSTSITLLFVYIIAQAVFIIPLGYWGIYICRRST